MTANFKLGALILGCLAVLLASSGAPASTRIHYSTLYKPATVETIRGEIVSLGKTISGNGKTYCETLTLKTDKGSIWVIMKPETFRPKTNLSLGPRDQVEITGSRVVLPGKAAIIAAEMKKDRDTMVLRDSASGRPAWAVGDDWHTR
jgi:hypothetical protein